MESTSAAPMLVPFERVRVAGAPSKVIRFSGLREPLKFAGPCERLKLRRGKRARPSAGHEGGKADRVATIEFKRIDLLAGDEFLHRGGFRLQGGDAGGYLHSLRGGADRERNVDVQVAAGVELIVRGSVSLEAGGFDADGIEAGRNICDGVIARFVRGDDALDAGLIADRDFRVRNDGS